ncbi:ABC transporter substrate-binding protein [Xanthobacteraceae bacterium Astr-EGSB]|uniref:ABC transporter substrate-binding protein n=1 Tax=Astrobacterium formosum TaxID=3069710 RepID=UPI0027AF46AD|nr:ABC transporter substrate-binding protein [Xanthobacteraceae bacterium Astr-EGSB]
MNIRMCLASFGLAATVASATIPAQAQTADIDKLIAAAKAEGSVVAYWMSARIANAGAGFAAKYGIKVLGTKMTDAESTEKVVREVESGNVQVDIIGYDDGPRLITEMIPGKYVENYVPPGLKDAIPEASRNPLIYLWQVSIFGYNTERYDKCPITNVWQLTEPKWAGKLHMFDPRLRSMQIQAFSAMEDRADELAASYEKFYGKPLKLTQANAGLEFIKRLAASRPVLYNEDVELAANVGARGQSDPPIGIYTLGRHREIKEKNLALGMCRLEPFQGINQPTYIQIVAGAPHPNAAKLFAHYLLTQEGVSPWTKDVGAYSSNPTLSANPDNPYPNVSAWGNSLLVSDNAHVAKRRQDLLDLWIANNR